MIHRVRIASFLVVALGTGSGLAMTGHPAKKSDGKPPLLSETGRHHHPIATTSPEAQKFFDQGMTMLFGFNHPAAARSFRRAAELDPKAVMPHWGIAVVLGPNYNQDIDLVDLAQHKEAYEALERAISLNPQPPVPRVCARGSRELCGGETSGRQAAGCRQA